MIRVINSISTALLGLALLVTTQDVRALVMTSDRGDWPKDWPAALEPYRDKSATINMATGMQEDIYEIGFDSRDEFESIWHVLCGLKSRHGTLTLRSPVPRETGSVFFGTGKTACVRIRCHVKGGSVSKPGGPKLTPCPPWPESAYLPDGTLPEYVTISEDGQTWVPAGSPNAGRGFMHRARSDLELVVDGHIIDLNRLQLPKDTRIIDERNLPGPAGNSSTSQPAEANATPPVGFVKEVTLPALAGRPDLPTVAMYVNHRYAMRDQDETSRSPQVIFAAWNDGYIVWSEDPLNGGAPYHDGKFEPAKLQELLTRMERQNAFTDLTLNYHHWGPDSSFTALIVADPARKRWLNMCSWHELHERKPTVLPTQRDTESLIERQPDGLLARFDEDEMHYRIIWSQFRAGLNNLVPENPTDPAENKELRFDFHTLKRDCR